MAISLSQIRRSTLGPPRIVVYGVPGIGKTTFAAQAPRPIFIPIEDGLGQLDVEQFPTPRHYGEVLDAIDALITQEHTYETVVIDTIDALEPMLWESVAKQASKESIEDFGYGKGYIAATAEWRNNVLAGLDELRNRKGMAVVLLAHSTVARCEPPDSATFDRYQLRLHKGAEAAVCDWADCVLFANYKVTLVGGDKERKRGKSDGTRVLHTTERAAWRAKNRYRLPDKMAFDWAQLQAGIVPGAGQSVPAITDDDESTTVRESA